mgnify:CR=1 FL=1
MKLSHMQSNAKDLVQTVMKRYQDVRALDGNSTVDKNPATGKVEAQIDEWKVSAEFDSNGAPVSFTMESRQQLPPPDREDGAWERRHSYSIVNDNGKQLLTYEYQGPDGYGGGFNSSEFKQATLDPASGTLLDYEEWNRL